MSTAPTSNLGKWDRWYAGLTHPEPYGDSRSYAVAAAALAECDTVEDWGCGKGWMRHHIGADRYRGIDGSHSPFADVIADLADYRSDVDGIVLRHVLEHDYRWAQILGNAARSFRDRLVVILFTPTGDATTELVFNADPGVPDISFAVADLAAVIQAAAEDDPPFDVVIEVDTFDSPETQYGVETILIAERCPDVDEVIL